MGEHDKDGMAVKVYVVLQHKNLIGKDEPNVRVVATRLTRGAAQSIVDAMPGTWIEKHVATKADWDEFQHAAQP